MKIQLLLLFLAVTTSIAFGQSSTKSSEKEYEKMKVPACTISSVNFTKGDTITIGQPSLTSQNFSFIHRRFAIFEGIDKLEKFRLSADWSNRLVLINEIYIATDGNSKVCYAEFVVGKDFHGWINVERAIETKEIVKLNSKDL
jgi:hypothetical protein